MREYNIEVEGLKLNKIQENFKLIWWVSHKPFQCIGGRYWLQNDLQPWQNCRRKFGGNDGGRQSALQSNNSKNIIHSQSFSSYQGKLITKLLYV